MDGLNISIMPTLSEDHLHAYPKSSTWMNMSVDSKVCIPYANRELIGSTLLLMCTEGDDHVIKLIKLEITRREE